jgi:hypothetical protein
MPAMPDPTMSQLQDANRDAYTPHLKRSPNGSKRPTRRFGLSASLCSARSDDAGRTRHGDKPAME